MIDCVVYISSVANVKKHPRKSQCLESFAIGVVNSGSSVHLEHDYIYTPSRLAVMLGWATTNTGGQNITLRKQIIAEQRSRGLDTMCIDANCWKYIDKGSRYLRYSLNGPFYDRAEYANHNSDSTKWDEIKQALRIELQTPQSNPDGHVLICMQRDGGFAMKELDPVEWLNRKIRQIRQHTQRQIIIRPHPGDYRPDDFHKWNKRQNNEITSIMVANPETTQLTDNLNGAHAAVFFNSSASVAAVCAGVPVFVDDQSCVAWTVANQDISQIESPAVFAREQWLYDLSAAHWSDADAQAGRIWQKFRPYLASTTTS
jgi:hypothetical protein